MTSGGYYFDLRGQQERRGYQSQALDTLQKHGESGKLWFKKNKGKKRYAVVQTMLIAKC